MPDKARVRIEAAAKALPEPLVPRVKGVHPPEAFAKAQAKATQAQPQVSQPQTQASQAQPQASQAPAQASQAQPQASVPSQPTAPKAQPPMRPPPNEVSL